MKYSLDGVSVFIGMPVNRAIPPQTTMSLIETVAMLEQRKIAYTVDLNVGGAIVQKSRSLIARAFLASTYNRLLMIDSDMRWHPKSVLRLLELSTVMDVVAGAYPQRELPITFKINADEKVRSNEHGCIPMRGMGLGFTIARRATIENLSSRAPVVKLDDGSDLRMAFRVEADKGTFRGEDICFFEDCLSLGAGVWCDPRIYLGHIGDTEFAGSLAEVMTKKGDVTVARNS